MYFVHETMRREEVRWHIVGMEVSLLARLQDVESLDGVGFVYLYVGENGRGGALIELVTDSV